MLTVYDTSTVMQQLLNNLNSVREENAHYMNILADLVDKSIEREYLKKAEQFQNKLIQNDISISVLLDSVLSLKDEKANSLKENFSRTNIKLKQIADDINTLQSYFETLKTLFKEEIQKS